MWNQKGNNCRQYFLYDAALNVMKDSKNLLFIFKKLLLLAIEKREKDERRRQLERQLRMLDTNVLIRVLSFCDYFLIFFLLSLLFWL